MWFPSKGCIYTYEPKQNFQFDVHADVTKPINLMKVVSVIGTMCSNLTPTHIKLIWRPDQAAQWKVGSTNRSNRPTTHATEAAAPSSANPCNTDTTLDTATILCAFIITPLPLGLRST